MLRAVCSSRSYSSNVSVQEPLVVRKKAAFVKDEAAFKNIILCFFLNEWLTYSRCSRLTKLDLLAIISSNLKIYMVTYEQIIKGLNIRPKVGFFGYSSVILLQDGEEIILFDTGGPGVRGFLFDYIKKSKISKVFLSHLHLDHCCNIDLFQGIPVYINQREIDDLMQRKEECYNKLVSIVVDNYLKNNNFQIFDESFQLTENIQAIATYGHTCGHSSLKFNDGASDVIIAGDAIETYQEYLSDKVPAGCYDEKEYKKTKRFITDNFNVIIPGHSSAIVGGKLLDDKLTLIYF